MVDDFDQAIIEVALRVAEALVGLLEEGVKLDVDRHHLFHIGFFEQADDRLIALVVGRIDHQVVTRPVHLECAGDFFKRAVGCRQVHAGEIVDHDHEPLDDVLKEEEPVEFLLGEQAR